VAVQTVVAPRRDSAGEPTPEVTKRQRRWRSGWAGYVFLAPGFALFVVVLLIPIARAVQVSFYQWLPFPGADNTFVGLDNYTRAVADPQFRLGLVNAIV